MQAELQAGISGLLDAFAQRKAQQVGAAVAQMQAALSQGTSAVAEGHRDLTGCRARAVQHNTVGLSMDLRASAWPSCAGTGRCAAVRNWVPCLQGPEMGLGQALAVTGQAEVWPGPGLVPCCS